MVPLWWSWLTHECQASPCGPLVPCMHIVSECLASFPRNIHFWSPCALEAVPPALIVGPGFLWLQAVFQTGHACRKNWPLLPLLFLLFAMDLIPKQPLGLDNCSKDWAHLTGEERWRVVIISNYTEEVWGIHLTSSRVRWILNPSSLGFSFTVPSWDCHWVGYCRLGLAYESFLLKKRFQRHKANILRALVFCSHQLPSVGHDSGGPHSCCVDSLPSVSLRQRGSETARIQGSPRFICHLVQVEQECAWIPEPFGLSSLHLTSCGSASHILGNGAQAWVYPTLLLWPLCCLSTGPQTLNLLVTRKTAVIHCLSFTHSSSHG